MKKQLHFLKSSKKALLFIIISLISYSGMAQWQLVMQQGGNIYSLVEQNNVRFAGTQFGVYKSTDAGVTWVLTNNGLTSTVVHPMLVNGTRLFAGTEDGVFISDDGGANWVASNQGLTISKITNFVLTSTGIFAGTDDQGVFYSTDNGATWLAKNTGLNNLDVKTLMINNARLFAGTDGGGVYYSDNLGANWTQSNSGLSSWFISHITSKDNKLFVSTNYKLYISNDNGLNWTALNTPFSHEILCSVNYNNYMFLGIDGDGVAYTTDYGQTWTLWNDGLQNKNMYCIEVLDNYVWSACCCGYGLFKRLLPGVSGIEQQQVSAFSLYPNPAAKELAVSFNLNDATNVNINMYNALGALVWNSDENKMTMGEQLIRVNTSAFENGVYYIVMDINGQQIMKKLIVQN